MIVLAVALPALVAPAQTRSEPPVFRDVTAASGVRFTCKGGSGRLLILDTMGAGLALCDLDGDGDLDLYLLTGSQLDPYPAGEVAPSNRLYRNDGGLRFTDVSDGSNADLTGWSMGCASADYDGDGDLDLYVTRYGENVLLRNDGNLRFSDVTAAAGAGDSRWSTGCAFFDHDQDGWLDLYVVNYVDFEGRLARLGGDLDHNDFKNFQQLPHYFDPLPNRLLRNLGDGSFEDVTDRAGVADASGKGLGVAVCDYDRDGDPDFYVANDTTANSLYRNNGDGTFDEVGSESMVAYNGRGRPEGSMGVAWGDVDGDQSIDLLVTNFDNEQNTLYRNLGEGFFEDASHAAGLAESTRSAVGWGTDLFDCDNDGDLDTFFANGHVITDVPLFLIRHLIPESRLPGVLEEEHFDSAYQQPDRLFLNDGRGRFVDASDSMGDPFRAATVSRGAAFGDLDDDGDLDLVVLRSNEPAVVLRNDGGNRLGWLEVELVAAGHDRFAVGARIELITAHATQVREVRSGGSYLGQNPYVQHFGLGSLPQPVALVVRWPSGRSLRLEGVDPNQRVVVREEETP